MCACVLSRFSCVQLFVTPWTVAQQAPLSMGFSKQEYWSGLPCPTPGYLPNPGIKAASLTCPVYTSIIFFSFLKSPLSQIRSHSLMSRHHSGHYGHRGRRHNLQGQLVQLHLFLGMHQSRALVLFWYHLSLLWNMPYLAQRSSSSRIHQKVPLSFSSLWEVRRILVKETLLGRAWRKATPVSQALWTSPVSDNLNRNLTDMPGEARL